jgi:hypothetical protein
MVEDPVFPAIHRTWTGDYLRIWGQFSGPQDDR